MSVFERDEDCSIGRGCGDVRTMCCKTGPKRPSEPIICRDAPRDASTALTPRRIRKGEGKARLTRAEHKSSDSFREQHREHLTGEAYDLGA